MLTQWKKAILGNIFLGNCYSRGIKVQEIQFEVDALWDNKERIQKAQASVKK